MERKDYSEFALSKIGILTPKDLQKKLKKGRKNFLSKIDGIFTYTRLLSAIASRFPEEIKMLQPKAIVLSGEIFNEATKICYKKYFPESQIIDTYSCIELGWISMTCQEGHMHVMEDFYLPNLEYVTESYAKLYLTFLRPTTTLLLNYDTGDLIEVIKDCKCGYVGLGFKFIKRHNEDDILKGITKGDILNSIDESEMACKYIKIENIAIKVEYEEVKTIFYIIAEELQYISSEIKKEIVDQIRKNLFIRFNESYTFKENLWDINLKILPKGKFTNMSGKVKLE
jgi:phenylacetate-coenzyme A ligase PaaK-like adenylate-forming protein